MARQMFRKVSAFLAGAALLLGAALATAETYDLAGQFSIAGNPNGTWSYGWSASRGGPFTLMTNGWTDYSCGTQNVWTSPVSPLLSFDRLRGHRHQPPDALRPGRHREHPPRLQRREPRGPLDRARERHLPVEGWFTGNDHGWTGRRG